MSVLKTNTYLCYQALNKPPTDDIDADATYVMFIYGISSETTGKKPTIFNADDHARYSTLKLRPQGPAEPSSFHCSLGHCVKAAKAMSDVKAASVDSPFGSLFHLFQSACLLSLGCLWGF